MSMTVKRLISELEKIENKLLEVEISLYDRITLESEIIGVQKQGKKVMIILERKK